VIASYAAGWQTRDLADLERRLVDLLILVARYLRQPMDWVLRQTRSWLRLLARETLELMRKERKPLGG
jgi:hypothetical protein